MTAGTGEGLEVKVNNDSEEDVGVGWMKGERCVRRGERRSEKVKRTEESN